jgi:hypothetical protein
MDRFGGLAAVGVVALSCGISAVAALSSLWWRSESVALVSAMSVVLFFVATRIFGYSELRLLAARLQSLASSFVSVRSSRQGNGNQSAVRLQGSREWNLLWAALTETAEELPLQRIELDVNAPSLREGYHATWESSRTLSGEKQWRFEMPLFAVGHKVGHIRIAAERTSDSASVEIERLLAMLEDVEVRLDALLRDLSEPASHAPAGGVLKGPVADLPGVARRVLSH